jgi:lipoate---protein ligase
MLQVLKYCLPDINLLEENTKQFLVWIPDKVYAVLGASNQPEESLLIENILQDNITVLKRPSGGQAVVLTPNNLIISCVFTGKKIFQPKDIFHRINLLIISALEKEGITGLSLMGISDIAISGKKILGSAIFRNKDKLLYQAVLNIGEPALTFEKYLKQPLKEPDYRNGRKHIDFVSSLKENGYTGNYNNLVQTISHYFNLFQNQEKSNKLFRKKWSSEPLIKTAFP